MCLTSHDDTQLFLEPDNPKKEELSKSAAPAPVQQEEVKTKAQPQVIANPAPKAPLSVHREVKNYRVFRDFNGVI